MPLCKRHKIDTFPSHDYWCKECASEFRAKNRERVNRNNQNWKERNREQYLAQEKAYYERNKEKYQEYDSRRKSLEKYTRNADKIDYLGILERDGMWCYLCETDVDPDHLSYDHVFPLSRGGTHTVDNIKITHRACNLSKNNRLPEEFWNRGD